MSISWNMILGGFGLFVFGIKFMGDGLKSVAGEKLRYYIDKYTTKPIMALFVGALITLLIQSSSATTAITIGLVRAGLMKLEQAMGIVMGANIGTTVTAFMIGLKIEELALYFVFIGAMLLCFSGRKKIRYIGEIILGFGLLFYGLKIMGDALKDLMLLPEFSTMLDSMSDTPSLAMLAGTVLTAIIQSSSAMIGVVQKMYESGGMTLTVAIAFVLGSNIGTTITGILASIGGSVAAKRTACFNTVFNVIGTLIAMMLLVPFVGLVTKLSMLFNLEPMMQIAVAHICFNIFAILLFFPFLKWFSILIKKIIPGNDKETDDLNLEELETVALAHASPSNALSVATVAVLKMGDVVVSTAKATKFFLNNKKAGSKDSDEIRQSETLINDLDHRVTNFLTKISREELTDNENAEINQDLQIVKNFERMGDISINLLEFFEMVKEDKTGFSEVALEEINSMFNIYFEMFEITMDIYKNKNYDRYDQLLEFEDVIDQIEYDSRNRHFSRMSDNLCNNAIAGSVFCDILGNLERMGDHCCNIAKYVLARKND